MCEPVSFYFVRWKIEKPPLHRGAGGQTRADVMFPGPADWSPRCNLVAQPPLVGGPWLRHVRISLASPPYEATTVSIFLIRERSDVLLTVRVPPLGAALPSSLELRVVLALRVVVVAPGSSRKKYCSGSASVSRVRPLFDSSASASAATSHRNRRQQSASTSTGWNRRLYGQYRGFRKSRALLL